MCLHNLLNVIVQIANKMGLQKKVLCVTTHRTISRGTRPTQRTKEKHSEKFVNYCLQEYMPWLNSIPYLTAYTVWDCRPVGWGINRASLNLIDSTLQLTQRYRDDGTGEHIRVRPQARAERLTIHKARGMSIFWTEIQEKFIALGFPVVM
jgi:hypothetical protein